MKKTLSKGGGAMEGKQVDSGSPSPAHVDRVPAPSREEARRRIRSKPGFYASLSPEARAAIAAYQGPEVIGPPD